MKFVKIVQVEHTAHKHNLPHVHHVVLAHIHLIWVQLQTLHA